MNQNIQNGISCYTPATCTNPANCSKTATFAKPATCYNLARFLKSALCLVAAAMLLTACGGGAGSNAASAQQEPEYTLQDGIKFFEDGDYYKAAEIFRKSSDKTAYGYLGIMKMHALGGYRYDYEGAKEDLNIAPNVTPFLVPKADLILMLEVWQGGYGSYYSTLNKAKDILDVALSERPDDKGIQLRLNVLRGIININKSDSYSFSNDETGVEGRYEGELGYGNNWTKFANGWGVYSWDTMESSMGKFSNCKLHGSGLRIIRYDFTDRNEHYFNMAMGTFKNDYLQEGLLIVSDGTQYFGTFKNGNLDKVTEERDVIGKLITSTSPASGQ